MNTPGVSLFQGSESIKINTSLERQEEEEALEDQRRRNEELGLMIQNAFDDLEDDETTIDSTTNFQSDLMDGGATEQQPGHQNHHLQQNQGTHPYANVIHNGYVDTHRPTDHTACEKEIHKFKMLAQSRSRELEHSQHLLEEEYKRSNGLEKKLTILEAELDRALSTKKNNHELLVESKEKISNLENTINKINIERKSLETEKNELLAKLETSQTLLSDVQRKYDMVERDLNKNQERNFELKRKQMEDRHRAEITMLQQQMEQVANKLDKKTSELESMNSRYQALQETHQMMLCEKASKINDLSHALDESQKRCNELLSRPDYFQENIRLQKLIASLQEQIQGMEKTNSSLKECLEMTTAELDFMNSVLNQHSQDDTGRRLSQTQGHVVGSTPINPLDRAGNLKEEFYRSLANIKSKRDEIRKLQQTLSDKQAEIKQLKQEENNSLVQISTLKEENIKLQNKLKVLEEEFDQLKTCQDPITQQQDNRVHTMQIQLEDLKSQLNAEKQKTDELEKHKMQQECERKKLYAQLKNLEIDLEELKQEHESLKLNYEQILKENLSLKQHQTSDNVHMELEKHKFLLKDSQTECDRLKNLYIEISNAKEALCYEMDKLLKTDKAKELQEEKEKVANLQRALKLAEVKCSELSKIFETEKLCHEKELADLRDKFEKEKLETSKAAKETANECTKCIDYLGQMTKLEIQNLKLTNINAINKKEIDELNKDLKSCREHLAELKDQLKLSEQQEHLIKELKTKATQFEEYIKSHSSSSEVSNNSPKSTRQLIDKSVTTSPELERNEIRKIEARIRDEMAHIYAVQLKRFEIDLQETQEQSQTLKREYLHINSELQQRQKEVNLLKQVILAEREKMEEVLSQKDEQHQDVVKELNNDIRKIRDELKTKVQRIKELTNDLNERQTQIERERSSMKAVMKQYVEHKKNVDEIEKFWKDKLTEKQKAHEITEQSLQAKYKSAVKMAQNYKRYAEDKEAFMTKQYDILQLEYDSQLTKAKLEIRKCMEKLDRERKQQALNNQKGLTNNKENTASNQKQ